jgi:hypothetical protein
MLCAKRAGMVGMAACLSVLVHEEPQPGGTAPIR